MGTQAETFANRYMCYNLLISLLPVADNTSPYSKV